MRGDLSAPPFFAVEVQELPRGAGVEWHAHTGIACEEGGVAEKKREVSVEMRQGGDEGWKVYDCRSGEGRVYSVFMLYLRAGRLEDGLKEAGVEGLEGMCGCYVDVSLGSEGEGMWARGGAGMIPCRSIWDEDGRRISAVLLFDREDASGR